MKKLFFLFIFLVLCLNIAFGRDYSIRPEKGTKGLSFSVRGLGSLGVGGVGAGIGGKYWRSENLVYKLSVGFKGERSSGGYTKYYLNADCSILPGLEYHYFPTNRISPYWGTGISFSVGNTVREYSLSSNPLPGRLIRAEEWRFSGGAYLSLGIEWIIIKNLSIGGEYQVTFSYQRTEGKEFMVPGEYSGEIYPEKDNYSSNNLSLTWGTSSLIATFYF
jgi:hypothetical protein